MSQSKKVLVVNSTNELNTELSKIVDKDKVRKLYVLIPPNNVGGWKVYPPLSAKVNYESVSNKHAVTIERLPEVLAEFTSLEELDLSNTGLKHLDKSLLKLSKLRRLNISENNILLEDQLSILKRLDKLQTIIAFDCGVSEKAINKLQKKNTVTEVIYTIQEYTRLGPTFFSWRQQHMPLNEKEETLFQLLETIHQYYPIGLSGYRDKYPGAKKFRNIETQWAEALLDGNQEKPWWKAITALRNQVHDLKVHNNTSLNYPSNSAIITLDTIETSNATEIKNLYLVQSIYTNHFTIFIDSRVQLKNYQEIGRSISQRIIYGKQNANQRENELIALLIVHMNTHFPSYTFVGHKLLMETMITGGIPRGGDLEYPKPQYAIYDFLFGNELGSGDYKILE